MKKNIFSTVLLVFMIVALMICATGCGSEDANAEFMDRIAELEQENTDLLIQIDELNAQLDRMKQTAALQDWTLDASAWADGTGATVSFSATPVAYIEGMRVALSVRMGDLEAESTHCNWNGTTFTGSVDLSGADGYGYYCVLTSADGIQTEVELNTPANPTNEELIYLGTSLNAYANLVVEDWNADDTHLNVNTGYAQAQMPLLTFNNTTYTAGKAEVVLHLNGEELSRQEIALSDSDSKGGYEAAISGISFEIPAIEDDCQLDLWLEITLSNGNLVSAAGGSWYSNGGDLQMVVG